MLDKRSIGRIISRITEYKWMRDAKEQWVSIQNSTDQLVSVDYEYDFVIYQNQYFKDAWKEYQECSCILYDDNKKARAIYPLCIYRVDEKDNYHISSWGTYLLEPIVSDELSEKGKRQIYNCCLSILRDIANEYKIDKVYVRTLMMENGASLYQRFIMEMGACIKNVSFECMLNLDKSEEDIFRDIRSTYRRYIRKASKRWSSRIVDSTCSSSEIHDAMSKFRELHIDVAQRETRSLFTWELQEQSVIAGSSIVVLLYDGSDLVGASLHSSTATMAYYGVGAFKRELFREPVSHLSQWRAIQYYAKNNVQWYDIGWRCYWGDIQKPSEKEINIGYFKEGFATSEFACLYNELIVSSIDERSD